MHVKFLKEHEVKVCDRNTKTYPAGWSGEIDDDVAAKAIKSKKAERVVAADARTETGDDGKNGAAAKADAGKGDGKAAK